LEVPQGKNIKKSKERSNNRGLTVLVSGPFLDALHAALSEERWASLKASPSFKIVSEAWNQHPAIKTEALAKGTFNNLRKARGQVSISTPTAEGFCQLLLGCSFDEAKKRYKVEASDEQPKSSAQAKVNTGGIDADLPDAQQEAPFNISSYGLLEIIHQPDEYALCETIQDRAENEVWFIEPFYWGLATPDKTNLLPTLETLASRGIHITLVAYAGMTPPDKYPNSLGHGWQYLLSFIELEKRWRAIEAEKGFSLQGRFYVSLAPCTMRAYVVDPEQQGGIGFFIPFATYGTHSRFAFKSLMQKPLPEGRKYFESEREKDMYEFSSYELIGEAFFRNLKFDINEGISYSVMPVQRFTETWLERIRGHYESFRAP
jgi:hypothetical protein